MHFVVSQRTPILLSAHMPSQLIRQALTPTQIFQLNVTLLTVCSLSHREICKAR